MTGVSALARLTFQEARRRRTVLAALALGALFLLVYGIGFRFITRQVGASGVPDEQLRIGFGLVLLVGFYGVHFLTVMLSIFSSAGTLSSEIASHTIQAVVTKPLRRSEVILGKWLGHSALLGLYILLLGGGILVLTGTISGYWPAEGLVAIAILILESLVLLAVSLLGGTRLSTTANGVVLFLFYALAFNGSWVGQLGTLFQSDAAMRIGTVTSYLLPVEALWRRAASLLTPDIPMPPTPFTAGFTPGPEMVPYAVLYAAVALALAAFSFGRRDL